MILFFAILFSQELDLQDFQFNDSVGQSCLFPLGGVVLFPSGVLPLHIFEPRYRQMMADALNGDRMITIVQPKMPLVSTLHGPQLEKVGCLGKILDSERLQDGRYNLLLAGMKRVKIVNELEIPGKLYRTAILETIDDERLAQVSKSCLSEMTHRFLSLLNDTDRDESAGNDDLRQLIMESQDASLISDLICQSLSLPPAMKQILLEENDVPQRVTQVLQLLRMLTPEPVDKLDDHGGFPPKFSLN